MPGLGGGPPPPPLMGMPPPPMPGMVPMPGMTQPDVLPHGLKPKKKWEVNAPLKKANWKTVSGFFGFCLCRFFFVVVFYWGRL